MHGKVADCVGNVGTGGPGSPTFTHRSARKNNLGERQTTKPRVSAWETKDSKLLAINFCEGCKGRRNSHSHRRVH